MFEREFWLLTPARFMEHVAIFQRRQKHEWERAAFMVHHIMTAFIGKNAPSVDELLGRVTDA